MYFRGRTVRGPSAVGVQLTWQIVGGELWRVNWPNPILEQARSLLRGIISTTINLPLTQHPIWQVCHLRMHPAPNLPPPTAFLPHPRRNWCTCQASHPTPLAVLFRVITTTQLRLGRTFSAAPQPQSRSRFLNSPPSSFLPPLTLAK